MVDTEGYTSESIVLAVAPKVPALMSIGGSVFIIYSVLTTQEKKNSIYQRLMLGLSLSDILASHIYFLGTWLIPKGSSGPFGDVFMAFGTDSTCSYSGFFNQLAVASPLYNLSLSTYYLLRIQRGWKDRSLKKIEPLFHIVPILFALGTAITAAVGDMYGNVFWTCWINPDPPQPNFRYFQWSFLFGPVWLCIILQLVVMTTLWWTMRKQEQLISKKYALREPDNMSTDNSNFVSSNDSIEMSIQSGNMSEDDGASNEGALSTTKATKKGTKSKRRRNSINDQGKYSSRIAAQGALYVLAFFITWFFPTVQRITELANGTNYFAIQALDTTLLPLQGFFNVLIYLRPKFMHYRRKYQDIPSGIIFQMLRRPKDEFDLVRRFRRKSEQSKTQNKQSTNKQAALVSIPEQVEAVGPVNVSVGFGDGISRMTKESKDDGDATQEADQNTSEIEKNKQNHGELATAKRIDMVGKVQNSWAGINTSELVP